MMMMDLHQLAQISAQGVLNSIAAGVTIALFTAALLRVSGRRNSGTRFAVWFSALLAIILLPIFNLAPDKPLIGSGSAAITLSASWAGYLLVAWALISTFALLRVAFGIGHLVSLRRSCSSVNPRDLHPVLQSTIAEAQAVRRIAICSSDRLQVPTAIGFLRPAVVLPDWTLRELSTAELNAILLHELAHLRRWDDWTNLAQKLARAILFFHPAVWWIENQLSVEREMACDEIALARTDPKAYAQCLVHLAEKNFMHRGLAMAQAAVHRAGQTAKRLAQILDRNRPAATLVSKPAVATVIVFATACFAVAPHTPQIVAFREKAPVAVSAVPSSSRVPRIIPAHTNQQAPKVVPASFVVPERTASKASAKPAAKASHKLTREDQERALHLVRTNAPRPTMPAPTFVVMQTRQQFNQAGPNGMVWTLTVWRVTVIRQDQPEPDPALSSKST
jgi:beta-lactamase regulating signal transducer with metallopeptidase domain